VTTRLIALVMLPVTVACVLAGSVVLSHRTAVERAVSLERAVPALQDLVELREALYGLRSVSAFDVRLAQAGVNRATAATFLGFDLDAQIAPERTAAKRAASRLGVDSPAAVATLQTLFAGIDGGRIFPSDAVQQLTGILRTTEAAVTRRFDRLEADVADTPLVAALQSLRIASALVEVTTPQVLALSKIWFQFQGDTPQTTSATLAAFGADSADYADRIADLHSLGVTSVVATLARVQRNAEGRTFEHAVAGVLRGEPLNAPGAAIDLEKVAAAFRGYLVRATLLHDVVATADVAVRDEARGLADSERHGYLAWAFAVAALAIASIGIALALARSITKPLKSLAGYARAVTEGQLDAEPAFGTHHGPREARVAFTVLSDLVANLQLLDAKANALAHCDFDNPALQQPLPGRLGRSLESSVALLSGSIVERDELQNHLAHDATHDALTGIFNRPAAVARIEAAMQRADRNGATTAVLFIDLNEFKAVNDSYGHEGGDEVLRQIAIRMTAGLRPGDVVARLGGDEFVIVAEDVGGVENATDLARRIIDTISEPIELGGHQVSVGAAVGIALTLDGPEEPLRLLARADAAMYRAKHHERSAIEIFDAGLQQQMIEREDIEAALRAALADPSGGGLQLHYQPVLDAASGHLVSAEALIRWDRPDHGRLPPDSFIPIAEATSLIIDLDCWVLAEATRQLVAWSDIAQLADTPVSVNISGRHLLSGQLSRHIAAVLDATGVQPERLSIEITETVLLTDLIAAAAELDAVRALGVKVAIDDFGTGYTSLAHLQKLPIDTIKIDRSFVSQLNLRQGSSLVRMVTDLGHAIDINIVAEGVETDGELQALQAIGADHLQGFLLSRPLEPAALVHWATGRVPAPAHAFG
jgi:diguanylate cyclase (GGDEF)-like protein